MLVKGSMNGVMTNDKIEVQIQREGDRYRGELTRVWSVVKRKPFLGRRY